MEHELTKGPVMKTMLLFAVPMILGDLLQQCYNIADTLIVGRFLGDYADFMCKDWRFLVCTSSRLYFRLKEKISFR